MAVKLFSDPSPQDGANLLNARIRWGISRAISCRALNTSFYELFPGGELLKFEGLKTFDIAGAKIVGAKPNSADRHYVLT